MTLESLIEEIENRKQYALDRHKEVPNSIYWTGYYDALGELLEFIEDDTDDNNFKRQCNRNTCKQSIK